MNYEEYQNLLVLDQETVLKQKIDSDDPGTILQSLEEFSRRIQKCNISCWCCNGAGLIPKYDFIRPYDSTVLVASEVCHICRGLGRILYEL